MPAPVKKRKLSLPNSMLKELGIPKPPSGQGKPSRSGRYQPALSRKDRRKTERVEKRLRRAGAVKAAGRADVNPRRDSAAAATNPRQRPGDGGLQARPGRPRPPDRRQAAEEAEDDESDVGDDEDGVDFSEDDEGGGDFSENSEEESDKAAEPKLSKAQKQKLDAHDKEIAALEKKLGIKGKKIPKSFREDGLADLLEGLGYSDSDDSNPKKRRAEYEDWLAQKRRKASHGHGGSDKEDTDEDMDEDADGPESDEDSGSESGSGSESFEGFNSSEDGESDEKASEDDRPKKRENPYVPPSTNIDPAASATKYTPPSLRQPSKLDEEAASRLRRRAQGLLNRLTEANMVSILDDVEKLYASNPRHLVTSAVVELLLVQMCDPASLPDTILIMLAGFVTAAYRVFDTDFGASFLERLVALFREHHAKAADVAKRGDLPTHETSNLITVLAELYNFQAVTCQLLFDLVRLLVGDLSELNATLLLRIFRLSGTLLRRDDPLALKDVVKLVRSSVAALGEANISVRTRFAVETIYDLKNNKMKASGHASGIVEEHTTRIRKVLGSIKTSRVRAAVPLNVGIKDLMDSDKKGKWWLVGASWAGNDDAAGSTQAATDEVRQKAMASNGEDEEPGAAGAEDVPPDLNALARQHGMTTALQRSLFVAVTSSHSVAEARARIGKLSLTKRQQRELPSVIFYCGGVECGANPYYVALLKSLCGTTHRMRWALRFQLWQTLRGLGETLFADDDEDDGDGGGGAEGGMRDLPLEHIAGLAKMFGQLIADRILPITVLRCLDFRYLRPETTRFLQVLLMAVLLECRRLAKKRKSTASEANYDEEEEAGRAVATIFASARDATGLAADLQTFMAAHVRKPAFLATDDRARRTVRAAWRIADGALAAAMRVHDGDSGLHRGHDTGGLRGRMDGRRVDMDVDGPGF